MTAILFLLLAMNPSPSPCEPVIAAESCRSWVHYPAGVWGNEWWPEGRYRMVRTDWHRLDVGVQRGKLLPKPIVEPEDKPP